MSKKTEQFQTEVTELLQLIIHSLYSHPEIFLRELISNASDALDKLKLESLTTEGLTPEGYEPEIRLTPNKEGKTLTVTDNGIGMTLDEVRENIGRIAHSGTKQFLARAKELEENPELIGQFGVGFYSAFMVADRITLETQKAGEETGVKWESDGKGEYSLEEFERSEGNGTSITLHLKEIEEQELPDFSDEWVLRSTVKKHSDFIVYPVKMLVEREEPVPGKEDSSERETVIKDETLNSQKAIWLRAPQDITEEEYNEFYQGLSFDQKPPLKTVHYKAEGTIEFSSLLYIPGTKPWNYDYENSDKGLNLYVKRVLIMSDCEDVIPAYLRFMRGVVDSSDLSLNVSREILQHNRQITQIRKALTNKILSTLKELLTKDREKYIEFWNNFGGTLKEGLVREGDKAEKLLPLFLSYSSKSEELTTLKEYVERMADDQKAIYFITGESVEQLKNSPYLERLEEKGYEVLFLTDSIDQFIEGHLTTFEEKPFQQITAADFDLDSEEEKKEKEEQLKEKQKELQPLMDSIRAALQEDVEEVKLSTRLTDSPVCLVTDSGKSFSQLEHLYRQMGQEPPKVKWTMELNPEHPLFGVMGKLSKDEQANWASVLYGQALLSEGSKIPNPAEHSKKIAEIMVKAAENMV